MAVASLRTLTAADVVALPLPDLGLAVLVDWYQTESWSPFNWGRAHRKRWGKDDAAVGALMEALQWCLAEGYLCRDYTSQGDDTLMVTRRGKQALGLAPR